MKNLKRFVVVFMAAALFSTSFTSCVDNEVDPAVLSIYRSQADLIAAQVALLEAEAMLLEAQAAHEQAMADIAAAEAEQIAAITEGIQNDNAYDEMVRMQQLMLIEAETAAEVARLQNEMALAQQQFEIQMANLMAQLAAQGANIAMGYAGQYASAMSQASYLKGMKLNKENEVADLETELALEVIEMAEELEMLQMDIDNATAEIAMINQMIAEYQAILDDPTTSTAQVAALKEQRDALYVQAEELNIDIVALENQFDEVWAQKDDNDEIIADYEFQESQHEYVTGLRDGLVEDNEDLADDIETWTMALADYDAGKAAFEQAVADADDAITAAWTALGMTDGAGDDVVFADYFEVDADGDPIAAGGAKYAAPANLQEVLVNARIDALDASAALTAAEDAKDDLQTIIDGLEADLNTAAATLNGLQAGLPAFQAATLAAEGDYNAAVAARVLAEADYELWRDRFEGGPVPFGGFTWEDTTDPSVILGDDVLGIQDPASGVAVATYARVETWLFIDNAPMNGIPEVEDEFAPLSLGLLQSTIDGVAELAIAGNGTIPTAAALNAFPNGAQTSSYWVEVGLDDESTENLVAFQAATAALGNDDIYFNNPPMAGATTIDPASAWRDQWEAEVAWIEAQEAEADYNEDLMDAEEEYNTLKDIYENEVQKLQEAQDAIDAAEVVEEDAEDAETAAYEAVDDAWDALGDDIGDPVFGTDAKADPANTLYEERWNAILDLEEFCDTTKEELAEWIADAEAQIAENELLIAEFQIILDALDVLIDSLQDAYDEALLTPIDAALEVQLYGLDYQIEQLKDLQDSLEMQADLIDNTIDAIEDYADGYVSAEDIEDMISDLEDDIMYLEEDIAYWTDMLTMSDGEQLEYDAWVAMMERKIARCNDEITNLEAQIANWEALAAEYKALMEAALTS